MLPALRSLDFMPSPVPDRPGLLIRDPYRFSDSTLVVPPALATCLEFFDGAHNELDLRAHLVKLTGDLDVGGLLQHLVDTLSGAGFLEDERFEECKRQAEQNFSDAPEREALHAGSGYPADPTQLRETVAAYMDTAVSSNHHGRVLAIAAPHVSPFGGVEAYRAAYGALSPEDGERTFVILGTSHYGHPDRLGLTRKSFVTPLGAAITDTGIVDRIQQEAGDGVLMEDYCHAIEHSIEFQVVFLQHLFGPQIRIVPILCGSYSRSLYKGGLPEDTEPVRRVLGALGDLAATEGDRLLWVLGIDMAHMGQRYGDKFKAEAGRAEMQDVESRDRARIQRMEYGDAQGFWDLVRENYDDLKWCGSAPVYTFLRAMPSARGSLLHYQQWNIDEHSVVSFAGMQFHSS
jgi:AmmeMemoRadiSam system protein B